MEAFVVFPALCIFLSVFAWVVTFFQADRPARALGISILLTLPFVVAGIIFADALVGILFLACFVLGPLAAVFVTYALFRKLGFADSRRAWIKATVLFLICALGILAVGYACLLIAFRHYPGEIRVH